jgi:hypothetical protein
MITTLKFDNEIVLTASPKDAERLLKSHRVSNRLVSKDGNLWRVHANFQQLQQERSKSQGFTDPDAR